jgi:cytochrome c oxidase subunit 2
MTIIIGILAVVFLVMTFMVLSKTQSLLKGIRPTEAAADDNGEYVDDANNFNGYAMFGFWVLSVVGVVWSFLHYRKDFLPEAASVHGKETDYWFWVSMAVIMVGFFVVNTLLFYFAYKYRFKKGRVATFYPHNNKLEVIWTVIPAVIMAGLVFTGLKVWTDVMADAPADAEVIEIMGKQFGWQVRYPGVDDNKLGKYDYKLTNDAEGNEFGVDFADENSFDDFVNPSVMHVPAGRPVLLKIRARDVLHSVFIPHMRVKMDAVPGMPTKFWFTPTQTTDQARAELGNPDFNFEIACTEVCGRGHFAMKLILVVDDEASYEKWKREQKPLLATNPLLIEKVPANLKAKAMKYLPVEEGVDPVVAEEVATGGAGSQAALK